jgi:hypothetical protein
VPCNTADSGTQYCIFSFFFTSWSFRSNRGLADSHRGSIRALFGNSGESGAGEGPDWGGSVERRKVFEAEVLEKFQREEWEYGSVNFP